MRLLSLLLIGLLTGTALAGRWPEGTDAQLAGGEILSIRPLSKAVEDWDGSNDYHVLTLANGIKGVFRSEDEPWGSVAEAAAYRFDLLLGTELVPPTVRRTLRREELGPKWPWNEETRPGSLQLFVEGARPAQESDLSQPDLANSEILCFLLGRYDNHSGNLLAGPDGWLLVIDFEGALDIQKVRYGEFSFIRRGGRYEGGVPATESFPFDEPLRLVDPTLEEIQEAFDPWWGQYWPQGMVALHGLLKGIPERTIRYVLWDNRLWVQVPVRSRHPVHTAYYPEKTIRAIQNLNGEKIDEILTPPFGPAHKDGILERREQMLNAAGGRLPSKSQEATRTTLLGEQTCPTEM